MSILREKADAYRKSVLEKVGYFDGDSYPHGGEDVDMSIKLRNSGYKIILSDTAMVEHVFSSRQSSLISVYRKAFEMGQAGRELYRRYGIDGIRRRMFLMILLSFLVYPIAYTNLGIFVYLGIFLAGLFSRVSFWKIEIPISLISLSVAIFAYLYMKNAFSLNTGIIVTHLAIMLYYGAHSLRNSLDEGDSLVYAIPIFLLSILWRFVSALGYLKEELIPSRI
jgi:hypothetical protein